MAASTSDRRPRRVHAGAALGFLDSFPMPLIARLPPGLMVDAGAATGDKTMAMRFASPDSRVIAYEPFPGNLPLLGAMAGGDPMITVRPAALADREGRGMLHVPSVFRPQDPALAAFAGTARGGRLGRALAHRTVAKARVPVVTLDAEIAGPVRFLKIDVQGGELNVLKGARRLIETHGIDLIYVEFRGDPRVLGLLDGLGYTLFDGVYMAWPHRRYPPNWMRPRARWRVPAWPHVSAESGRTGTHSRYLWPPVPARGFAAYCAWFAAQRLFTTGLQTDLLCVHERFRETFEGICAEMHG